MAVNKAIWDRVEPVGSRTWLYDHLKLKLDRANCPNSGKSRILETH